MTSTESGRVDDEGKETTQNDVTASPATCGQCRSVVKLVRVTMDDNRLIRMFGHDPYALCRCFCG